MTMHTEREYRAVVETLQAAQQRVAAFQGVFALAANHSETWRGKPDAWDTNEKFLDGLLEEVNELHDALNGKHEHNPSLELEQIASICLNWIEMRGVTENTYGREILAERNRLRTQVEAMREAMALVSERVREGGGDTGWDNMVRQVRAALAQEAK